MKRYATAFGFMTRKAAKAALDDMICAGEVRKGEKPLIEPYETHTASSLAQGPEPVRRYCITLLETRRRARPAAT
ncbi:MAG: hypothetical protein V9G18_14120 [Albidovulum sp.]